MSRRTYRAGDLVTVAHPASLDPKKWPPNVVDTVYFPGAVENGRVVFVRPDGVVLVEDLDRELDEQGERPAQYVHTHYITPKD